MLWFIVKTIFLIGQDKIVWIVSDFNAWSIIENVIMLSKVKIN